MTSGSKRVDRLYALAESQQGYFTSADARSLGYDYPHQHFHVAQGNWIRVDRGIYRLKNFPASEHEEMSRWWLWSRKKGVISHESAAEVHDLGDIVPSKVHLSVPPNFRKKPARDVVLHKLKLEESDIEGRNGFRVTSPLRTIMDLARTDLDPERLSQAAKDAVKKGLLVPGELLEVLTKMPEQLAPSTRATLQLAASPGSHGEYADKGTVDDMQEMRETTGLYGQPEPPVRTMLVELKSRLRLAYGGRLKAVYLFGSHARGEADQESDLDVLLVLSHFQRYAHEVDRTAELAADLSLKYGLSLSLVFMREREWLHGDSPFLSNVRDEAIPA